MIRPIRFALLSSAAATALLLTGCQSDGSSPAFGASTRAVTCDKCEMRSVRVPIDGGKNRVVGYRTRKRMECPDCKSAVANFFTTGKLAHSCRTCGENLAICDAH